MRSKLKPVIIASFIPFVCAVSIHLFTGNIARFESGPVEILFMFILGAAPFAALLLAAKVNQRIKQGYDFGVLLGLILMISIWTVISLIGMSEIGTATSNGMSRGGVMALVYWSPLWLFFAIMAPMAYLSGERE